MSSEQTRHRQARELVAIPEPWGGDADFDLAAIVGDALDRIGSPVAAALTSLAPRFSGWAYIRDEQLERLPFKVSDKRAGEMMSPDGVRISVRLSWLGCVNVTNHWAQSPDAAARLLHAFFYDRLRPSRLAAAFPDVHVDEGALSWAARTAIRPA